MSPIIGERGFAAMYKRCLHLIRVDYPWLAAVHEAAPAAYDFTALQTARTKTSISLMPISTVVGRPIIVIAAESPTRIMSTPARSANVAVGKS